MNRHRYAESDTTERLNWTELNIYIHITQCMTWILVSFLCGCCSVAQLCPILRPRELQLSRLPCSSLSPRVCSDSRPLSLWCHPTISFSVPSIFPSIRVFSSESALCIRWPKYWNFGFSISPSNEYSGLISFRMDCFDLLAVQRTLKSLLQHQNLKAPVLQCSAFFIVQTSHPHMTIGKSIALTIWTFAGKLMSLLFNTLSLSQLSFQGASVF